MFLGESNIDSLLVLHYDGKCTEKNPCSEYSKVIKESLETISSIVKLNMKEINLHVGCQWDVSFTKKIGNLQSFVAFVKTICWCRAEIIRMLFFKRNEI